MEIRHVMLLIKDILKCALAITAALVAVKLGMYIDGLNLQGLLT